MYLYSTSQITALQRFEHLTMAFQLPLVACFLIHIYGATVVFAVSSWNAYTDDACQSLYANLHTSSTAGNGECGQFNGIYSARTVSLDSNCYRI